MVTTTVRLNFVSPTIIKTSHLLTSPSFTIPITRGQPRKISTSTPNKSKIVASFSSSSSSPGPSSDSTTDSAQDLLRALDTPLEQLEKKFLNADQVESESDELSELGKKISNSQGFIDLIITYIKQGFNDDVNSFLESPLRLLPTSAGVILFGFFSATSATTIIGSVADWDPLAAAVLLILTEGYTKFYYSTARTSKILQLINAFKIGLIYGMVVDSFKLCT